MENRILTQVEEVRLPLKVKICYGFWGLTKALLAVTMATFMMYFYVDVCELNSGVASTIILIAKIWDIVSNPMMGAIVDSTKSKEGIGIFHMNIQELMI